MTKKNTQFQIRNSAADFLIFTRQNGENGIAVRVEEENVWLRAEAIAELFQKDRRTIQEHFKNIFISGELNEKSVCRNFRHTADDGKNYQVKFYNLEAIIAVGYRVDSHRAIEFRRWATTILSEFSRKGYVLDKNRLINDQVFSKQYFDELLAEIQEIRASERKFYQKITDIYATAVDYDCNSSTTKSFFANVQNKLHFAVHRNSAAELIVKRADHTKENMGLTNWKNAPNGKIIKTDVSIAKNYLSQLELSELNEIVTMYLDYANRQARKYVPMTMEDWRNKLDVFLEFNDEAIGDGIGKITHEIAKSFAESEFEKFRVIQDKSYQSDFDKLLEQAQDLKSDEK
ncbi:MAG: cell filamentation protein Fic [Bacteroidales bacterium 36-12]|nr:MAG: cell filamentation protein Fic [Bacteroidales bacterium 36-12]